MSLLDEIRQKKEELGFSCREISDITGVPLSTVQKVFSGETAKPRRDTLSRLADALLPEYTPAAISAKMRVSEMPASYGSSAFSDNSSENLILKGKQQGEYTLEDYLALPDDERYELIDGVLYAIASPTSNHQEIAGYLYHQLMNCVEQHDAPCRPYIAPLDVQLDKDNRTILQPDVIVNCDPEKNIGPRLFGAPDFVAEVLSPSSSNRDLIIKLNKYFCAGVREYWILDPKKRTVTVYVFGEEADPAVYSFEDEIPVGISEGRCTISMKGIIRWLI